MGPGPAFQGAKFLGSPGLNRCSSHMAGHCVSLKALAEGVPCSTSSTHVKKTVVEGRGWIHQRVTNTEWAFVVLDHPTVVFGPIYLFFAFVTDMAIFATIIGAVLSTDFPGCSKLNSILGLLPIGHQKFITLIPVVIAAETLKKATV